MSTRCLVVWIPDWPVRAAGASFDEPVATIAAQKIVACTATAREHGVRRGQRKRDAQGLCPELRLLPHDALLEARVFDDILRLLGRLIPGIHQIRPGACAFRMRGAARYYGGEEQAARRLLDALRAAGYPDARAGVSEGVFAAEQAARHADPLLIVPEGSAREFLAPLPVSVFDDAELTLFLARLGVRTLGELSRLDAGPVRERLGALGARVHAIAAGDDPLTLVFRDPPREYSREQDFEPPLFIVDQIAFSVRLLAETFIDDLVSAGLVCTEALISVERDDGARHERVWSHPRAFEAADVVDRVRWQIQAWHAGTSAEDPHDHPPGVVRVRVSPHRTDHAHRHQPSLIGQGADARVHHALSRVQSLLGHEGVVTPVVHGGRSPVERETALPWGDALPGASPADLPWPGVLPPPLPTTIFPELPPLDVFSIRGEPVTVDEDDIPSAPPALLSFGIARRHITAWTGPWPSAESAEQDGSLFRFQLLDETGAAWLVRCDGENWSLEGRYD